MGELGNKFWLRRTEHGREKLFNDPQLFWGECLKYFTWCEENPLQEVDYRGKDADRVILPKMRAFSWAGLETFLDCDLRRYRDTFNQQMGSTTKGGFAEISDDFVQVLMRVGRIIYTQKFEGAAAGMLKENIISRDLGLADRQQNTQLNLNMGSDLVDYTELSDEALKEIKDAGETKRIEG